MEESPETGPNPDDGSPETMGASQTPPSDVPEGRTSMVRWAQFEDRSTIHQISCKKTWPLSNRTSNLSYHIPTDTPPFVENTSGVPCGSSYTIQGNFNAWAELL